MHNRKTQQEQQRKQRQQRQMQRSSQRSQIRKGQKMQQHEEIWREKEMQYQTDGECKNCIRQIIWSQQAENGGKSTPMESDGVNTIRATSRRENRARASKLTETSRWRHEGRLQRNRHDREDKLRETFWRRQLFMFRMTCSEHLFLAFFPFSGGSLRNLLHSSTRIFVRYK